MSDDYFKGYKLFKFIQLIILVAFAVTFFLIIFLDNDLRTKVFTNKNILTICVFTWAFMVYSVICIIMDFRQLEGHIIHDQSLKKTIFTDNLTGMPNRFSCDMIFDKYENSPDISRFGCALIQISNLDAINKEYGRSAGNIALKEFSNVIERIVAHYGFVGRNSGNEFLVVIESCNEMRLQNFADEINENVDRYNEISKDIKLEIKITKILNESLKLTDFRSLVAYLYNCAKG